MRAAEARGFDADLWRQLVDFGITTMRIPASAGGSNMGLLEAVLVAEEAGRHLVSVPSGRIAAGSAPAGTARQPGRDSAARSGQTGES